MRRVLAAAAVAAALLPLAGTAVAVTCPQGTAPWHTGLYSPTTGKPIYVCMPYPGP